MRVLGIDPGLSGALSVLDCAPQARPRLVFCRSIPTVSSGVDERVRVARLCQWLPPLNIDRCIIEKVWLMPGQDVAAGGKFMRAVGALEATALCCGIRLTAVTAAQWKNHFNLYRESKTERKHASLKLAREIIDGLSDELDGVEHDRAESMLIAVYGALLFGVNLDLPQYGNQPRLAV